MFVVEPLRPPVPTLTVLVKPVVVAPEPMFVVLAKGDVPKLFPLFEKVLPPVKVWVVLIPANVVSPLGKVNVRVTPVDNPLN
jgi:hypothetical protein